MPDAKEGCSLAVIGVRAAWKKFNKLLPPLNGKGFSLKLKSERQDIYSLCEDLFDTWRLGP